MISKAVKHFRSIFFLLIPLLLFLVTGCATVRYNRVIEYGVASWYGPDFHGKLTADGERYNQNALTAAHRTLPFNTYVKVINLNNGRSVVVRINDRGPYAKGRIIDLSKKAATILHMIGPGTARVKLVLERGNAENVHKNLSYNQGVGLFAVQVGAYSDRAAADQKSRRIRGTWIQDVKVNGQRIYRVYYGKFDNEDKAIRAKNVLSRKGIRGFVKEIQNY